MSLLRRFLSPPSPSVALEFSEQGVSVLRSGRPLRHEFFELPPGTIRLSPTDPNLTSVDFLQSRLSFLRAPSTQPAVLILPDFSARVALLPFDELPKTEEERVSLLKFRLRRSVPFDIDDARIAYHPQPSRQGKGYEVIAVAVARIVLQQYESVAQAIHLHPGLVTLSTLASLELLPKQGTVLLLRLTGRILSLAVLQNSLLRLFRCVPLSELDLPEIEEVLYPTVAYVEDELGAHLNRLFLCGFGSCADTLLQSWRSQYPEIPAANLQSALVTIGSNNAGAAGYFQSLEAA